MDEITDTLGDRRSQASSRLLLCRSPIRTRRDGVLLGSGAGAPQEEDSHRKAKESS